MHTDFLNVKDINTYYDLDLKDKDIEKLYPYESGNFDMHLYSEQGVTITFNPFHAMQYRNENYPIIAWGKYYKGQRVFAFKREQKRIKLSF